MKVIINGEQIELPRPMTIAEYVAELPADARHVAVARNGEVVPRHLWAQVTLQEGDVLEVVRMVGGGAGMPHCTSTRWGATSLWR
jgi:sulfur carrier protein